MGEQNIDTVRTAIGAGSVGFGVVATLSPGLLRRVYGDSTDGGGGALDYFGRTWGTRSAVLGALTLMATEKEERQRVAGLGAAMNALDSLVAFSASGMPGRTRVMAGLTSGAFAAAAGYVAMNS